MHLMYISWIILLLHTTILVASPEERLAAVQTFVEEMATEHGFEANKLMDMMRRTKFQHSIIKAISKPAESKPWYEYKEIFLTSDRIDGGVKFWRNNNVVLQNVSNTYGVPPEIIIAIIGVETRYGKVTGNYKVIDALATLAFGYPKRAPFFRQELKELLLLDQEETIEFNSRKGSYAGAMGIPQFMPSSYRQHAVDQDGDGKRDLWNSTADIIGSVANYFKNYGWKPGERVAVRAKGVTEPTPIPIETLAEAKFKLSEVLNSDITIATTLDNEPTDTLVSLIRLDGDSGNEYWIGFNNFYVITRYNHSNLYAMAVYQLSQKILALHDKTSALEH